MQDIHNQTRVGALVTEDYRAAGVFKKFDIDFCCGGGQTLEQACARRNLPLDELIGELKTALKAPAGRHMNFADWDLSFLIDFIVNKHHLYVREKLPEVQAFADKVATVHGDRHPETRAIAGRWRDLAAELLSHMQKEEVMLFPYVKKLLQAGKEGAENPGAFFGTVRHPIQQMEIEHDLAGEIMHQIRELSDNFTSPPDACTTYRVLYATLREFEENLHEHIHLENNILFPKAIDLEQAAG